MSNDWLKLLRQTLTRLKTNEPPRVAVVGVGHELRGDDAVGSMIADTLKSVIDQNQDVLVINGGHAPENQTSVLRRFAPNLVLLVDAAQMGEMTTGGVRWLRCQEISGLSASTHTIPLDIIAQYLNTELGCEVALIGIQPGQLDIGADLSPAVKQSADEIVQSLRTILNRQLAVPIRH